VSLSKQHAINSLLDKHHSKKAKPHHMAMAYLTSKQWLKIKSPIVDTNNHSNEIFPSFDSLNRELSSSFHLVDTFPNLFSFHSVNWKNTNAKIAYHNKLNSIYKDSLIDQNIVLIISDASVKNNITTSVSHIYGEQDIIAKTVHYAINITSTEAELFTIRYDINHVTQMQDIIYIIIIIYQVHPSRVYISVMFSTFTIQAYLPWQPSFSQHVYMVVIQLSGYSVFHDSSTPIQLSFLWQSHTPVSIPPLKPPLRAIEAIPLKPQASSILYTYI